MKQGKRTFFELLVILSGLVMALVVILLCSDEPATALKFFFTGPFSSAYFFGDMLNTAVPLIICGLAASVSFTASVWTMRTFASAERSGTSMFCAALLRSAPGTNAARTDSRLTVRGA